MKNISRRVFIKGMAVAAVATATSAVLAGCNTNMIPGTNDEGEGETVPTPSNTYTFKDGDNTLTVEAPKFEVLSYNATTPATQENIIIPVTMVNKLGDDLKYGSQAISTVTATKGYCLVLSAEMWDKENSRSALPFDSTLITAGGTDVAPSSPDTLAKDKSIDDGVAVFKNVSKNWAKIVVTAKLYKANADDKTSGNSYYYGEVIDKTTFTFTNN